MRKLIILAVVIALALMVAPAALAGNGHGGSKASVVTYSLSGNVTTVDADNGVVSVTVVRANKAARGFKGDVVDLKVAATTRLYERTADGDLVVVQPADISAGERITSMGTMKKTTGAFNAKRITIALPIGHCLSD